MGYGIWVVVDYGNGFYAHMNDVAVVNGQGVSASTLLGHSGCTGGPQYCKGPHVHAAWVQNPTLDSDGQPYNGTGQPQTPLYTFSQTPAYQVYTSLYSGEIVNGW